MLYICVSFCLLAHESHDFCQPEKEIIVCQTEQIHIMTIIFNQDSPILLFLVKTVAILSMYAQLSKQLRDPTDRSQQLEDM